MNLKNLLILFFIGIASGAVHAQSSIDLADYDLVFSDEFDAPYPGTVVDPQKWSSRFYWGPYVTINAEEQLYVDTLGINSDFAHTPFSISDGVLTIEAIPTTPSLQAPNQPGPNNSVFANSPDLFHQPSYDPSDVDYLSGLLATTESYNATHGYFEARLKFPEGQGLWPAFWLLNRTYVENSPEIDIVEFLGHKKNTVHHTMHYIDQADNYRTISTPTFETTGPDYTADFHTYGVAWDPKRMRFFVDGEMVQEVTEEEFLISTQSMYLILNLAVGGSWPGSPDADTVFPAKFDIDYVRAYERKSLPIINQQTLDDEYVLMFSDEFNGSNLDVDTWNSAFLWGPYLQINNEEQVYIDKLGIHQNHPVNPFEVSSGTLKIKAAPIAEANLPEVPSSDDTLWQEYNSYQQQTNYLEQGGWTPEYSSGILTTYDEFKFVNGYAEARIKMPIGSGLWPAFWLLNGYYVGPSPEMDIVEVRGSEPSKTHHSYHYQNSVGVLQSSADIYDLPASDVSEFHTYGFQWDRERMVWYVDGVPVREFTGPDVSQQLSYVILNLAVGGNFVSDVGAAVTPAQMEIDWVRVWQVDGFENIEVDVTPPRGNFDSPTANELVNNNHTFTGSAVEVEGSGLSPVKIAIRDLQTYEWLNIAGVGSESWTVIDADLQNETENRADWNVTINFPASLIGNFRAHLVLKDDAGNVSNSTFIDFSIAPQDFNPPVGIFNSPLNGESVSRDHTFAGSVVDEEGSSISLVRIAIRDLQTFEWLDSSGDGFSQWQVINTSLSNEASNSTDWSASINFPDSLAGNFRVHLVMRDGAGNVSTSTFRNFTIQDPNLDELPPIGAIDAPLAGDTVLGTHRFSGMALEAEGSGLDLVKIAVRDLQTFEWLDVNGNGSSGWQVIDTVLTDQTENSAEWSSLINFPASLVGDFRVHLVLRDGAGNVSITTRTDFSIENQDVTEPEGVLISPLENESVSFDHTFSGIASDAGGSGLELVRIAIRDMQTFNWLDINGIGNREWRNIAVDIVDETTDGVSWRSTISFPPSISGNYQVHLVLKDNAGNFTISTFKKFTIE